MLLSQTWVLISLQKMSWHSDTMLNADLPFPSGTKALSTLFMSNFFSWNDFPSKNPLHSLYAEICMDLPIFWKLQTSGSDSKESTYSSGDLGLIPGLGRCPGEGNGNPLRYFCQENPEVPGGLQSMGLQRVRHNWGTKNSIAPTVYSIILDPAVITVRLGIRQN